MKALSMPNSVSSPSRLESWRIFDRIAKRYDLLNRLLSLGTDVRWRKRMADFLPDADGVRLVDLATGTGDQALFLCRTCAKIKHATGFDLAENMLELGRKKVAESGLGDRVDLRTGDATDIPSEEGVYDAATISFGIRNVTDVPRALEEMLRVLKPGGRALILEFSLPSNPVLRRCYLFYFRHILPRIGALVSGDASAYRYLNQTVETFPYGENFCTLMKDAGFTAVKANPLTFGIATIYQGDASERDADRGGTEPIAA